MNNPTNERPWSANSAVDVDENKTRWREVGAAFFSTNEAGDIKSITVRVDALPLNGKLVLLPPRDGSAM